MQSLANFEGTTLNSRFLRELAAAPLKFSVEMFKPSELAAKYFFFIDNHRPIFGESSLSAQISATSRALNNFIPGFNDLELQFLKHTAFNALFAEHYYDYVSYYPGSFDNRYFSYAFTVLDNLLRGVSGASALKTFMVPPLLMNWIFGSPYFQLYGSTAVIDASLGTKKNGIDVLSTELNFLRFLVMNAFVDVTPFVSTLR